MGSIGASWDYIGCFRNYIGLKDSRESNKHLGLYYMGYRGVYKGIWEFGLCTR